MSSEPSTETTQSKSDERIRPRRYHSVTGYGDRLSPGTVVVDSEEDPDDQNEAIVVSSPFASIDEWNVVPWRDKTIADDNPTYNSDEWVTIVAFRNDLEEVYPYYCGEQQLSLTELNDHDIRFYAFPDSRLSRVGMQRTRVVDVNDILPSQYHTRSFQAHENEEFINNTRERELLIPYPTVRVRDTGHKTKFEVVDGHKRTWVAHAAGLDSIKCRCLYVDETEAARRYLEHHFEKLTASEKEYVAETINDTLNTTPQELLSQ